MKIASVIGATGYVGSAVVKCLIDSGFTTVNCGSRNIERAQWVSSLAEGGVCNVLPLALDNNGSNFEGLRNMMRGSDCVFFCAGFEEQR